MAKFTVTVELTGHATIEVDAVDVLEARETAQAQYKTCLLYTSDAADE